MKSNLLYLSMLLLVLSIPFHGQGNKIYWLWTDHLWVPVTLIASALVCIALYLYKKESLGKVS